MTLALRSTLFATAAFAVLAVPAAAQVAPRVVSFGDSLSDTGNLLAVTRATGQTPNPASPPYFQGRFTNGPVFTELLAGGLGSMQNAGTAALLGAPVNPNASQNYAFGGARTDRTLAFPTPGSVPVGLLSQIDLFARAGGGFRANDVATVYAGANDLNTAVAANNAAGVAAAATNVVTAAGTLGALRAPTVVTLGLPDLGTIPLTRANANPLAVPAASAATDAFNRGVAAGLGQVAAARPDTNFHFVEVAPALREILADPARFGFSNVTQACIRVASCAAGSAEVQNAFLFFDDLHPTARGHRLFADLVADHLTAGARAGDAASLSEVGFQDRLAGETALRMRARQHLAATDAVPQGADIVEPGFDAARWGNAYLSLEGMSYDRESSARLASYDYRAGTLRLGGDYRLSDGFLFGGAVSASQGEVRDARLSYDTQSFSADVYGTAVYGPAFVTLTAGIAHFDFDDFRRQTAVAGLVNRGLNTDGFAANVGAEIGTTLALGSGFTATPTLGLSYATFDVDGFTETGSAARIVYGGYDRDILAGAANLHLAYETAFAGRRAALTGRVGYEDVLSDGGNSAIVSRIAGSPARPSLAGFDDVPGRGFILGAGAAVDVTDALALEANYSIGFGDEIDRSHIGAVSLNYRF